MPTPAAAPAIENRGDEPDFALRVDARQIDEFDRHYDTEWFDAFGGGEVDTTAITRNRYLVEVWGSEPAAVYVAGLMGISTDAFFDEQVVA